MRKLFSVLIAVLMLILLVPIGMYAEVNVAEIKGAGGITGYATLSEALSALADGDTLTITADVTENAVINAANKTVVFDGKGKKLTGSVKISAAGGDLTLKNLNITSASADAVNVAAATADAVGTVKISGVSITTTSSQKGFTAGGYNTITVSDSSIVAASTAFQHLDDKPMTLVVENSYLETAAGYGFYGRKNSTYTFNSCVMLKKAAANYAAFQCVGASNGTGSTLTLNNCTVNSEKKQCFTVQTYQTLVINGGNYNSTNNFTCIYAEFAGAYCKITGGTFTCTGASGSSKDCSVAAIGSSGAVMDILGGTFDYTGGDVAGSAVIAGYKDSGKAGTVRITGGTFMSNSTLPVIDRSGEESTVELVRAKVENTGTSSIPASVSDQETVLSPGDVHYYGNLDGLDIIHSCSFENDLTLNYYVKADDVGDFENLVMTVEKEEFSGNNAAEPSTVTLTGTPRTVDGKNYIVFKFTGIASYQIGNTLTATLDGTKYGNHYTTSAEAADVYSVKQYAEDSLAETTSELFAELLVDLLNYGAASQTYFGYRTDALVNANLTAEQKALPANYDPDVTDSYEIIEKSGSTVAFDKRSVVFGANTAIKVYFSTAGFTGVTEDLKAVFKDEAGNVIAAVPFSGFASEGEDLYSAKLTTLPVYRARDLVKVEITENNTAVSDTLVYSIESYCARRLEASNSADFKELLTRTIKYADSADAYFYSINPGD